MSAGGNVAGILDSVFLALLNYLCEDIAKDTGAAAKNILRISSDYLSSDAYRAVDSFYELYFAKTGAIEQQKSDVNAQVDDIFDQLKAGMAKGQSIEEAAALVSEDEKLKQMRLSLSGIQKQLETIISLDAGIRNKLVPVLSSVQFEDAIRQRLNHLVEAWELVINRLRSGALPHLATEGRTIAQVVSIRDEIEAYYKIVLKEEAPDLLGHEHDPLFL